MRKFLISVVLLALVSGACGGNKNNTPASTVEGIKGAVLLASDFGPSYKRTSLDIDKRETSPIGCAKLDQVDEQYLKTTKHAADAGYQNGDDSTATQFADETIYSFKSVDEANAYFDGQVAGFDACKTFNSTDPDGTQTSGSMQSYAFPTIAEESYASTVTINSVSGGEAQSIAGPVVMLRKGTTFVGLLFFHVGNEPGLSGGEIEAIVRKAADKI